MIQQSVEVYSGTWPRVLPRQVLLAGAPARVSFAVVIPVHNAAATLEQTLSSILPQLRAGDAVYAVENGSTDDSWALLQAHAGEENFHALQTPIGDASVARNRGIEAATQDFVLFCDADDVWAPDKLDTLRAVLAAAPKTDIILHSYVSWIGDIFHLTGRHFVTKRLWRYPSMLDALLIQLNFFFTSAMGVRRSLIDFELFSPGLKQTQDYEAWCQLGHRLRHPCITYIDRPLSYYRFEAGLSRQRKERLENGFHIICAYGRHLALPARALAIARATLRTCKWALGWGMPMAALHTLFAAKPHPSIRRQ